MKFISEDLLVHNPHAVLMTTLNILYYKYKEPDKIPWDYILFFFEELEDPPEA